MRWLAALLLLAGVVTILVCVKPSDARKPVRTEQACVQPFVFEQPNIASETCTFTFSLDVPPDWWMAVIVSWEQVTNDLSLIVTAPDGNRLIDTHGANWEYYQHSEPLPAGIWALTVTDIDGVPYQVVMGFAR